MRILLISDIHGNFPALEAIDRYFSGTRFDQVINCGDSVVYAPFPNEVIHWLLNRNAISILGNTDKKVIRLLRGENVKKPSKPEKRIMYTHTAEILTAAHGDYLQSLENTAILPLNTCETRKGKVIAAVGIFHGSPAEPHEHLFDTTPRSRFAELATEFPYLVIVTGHSHTPYHRRIQSTHFINPGSAGRMFDGNPACSCAVLEVEEENIMVQHFRIEYDIDRVIEEISRQNLPSIYQIMYILGKKLN